MCGPLHTPRRPFSSLCVPSLPLLALTPTLNCWQSCTSAAPRTPERDPPHKAGWQELATPASLCHPALGPVACMDITSSSTVHPAGQASRVSSTAAARLRPGTAPPHSLAAQRAVYAPALSVVWHPGAGPQRSGEALLAGLFRCNAYLLTTAGRCCTCRHSARQHGPPPAPCLPRVCVSVRARVGRHVIKNRARPSLLRVARGGRGRVGLF